MEGNIAEELPEAQEQFLDAQDNKKWRGWVRGTTIVLGGSAFLYVGMTFWIGQSIWDNPPVQELLGLRELPLVIGLVLVGVCLRAVRFYYFSRRLRWTVPLLPSFVVFVASFSLTATPGKAGELLKSALLLRRYNTSVAESAGVLVVERLGDLLALLILASSGLLLFSELRYYFFLSVIVVGLICVAPRSICYPILLWSTRYKRLRPLAERLIRILYTIATLLKPEPFLIGLALALSAWGSEALAFSILVHRLPVEIPLVASFSIVGLSAVVGALSMLPGGLGSVEAVMVLLLIKLGVDLPSAAMTAILYRLCTLYLMTLAGFCFLGIWKIMNSVTRMPRRSREA